MTDNECVVCGGRGLYQFQFVFTDHTLSFGMYTELHGRYCGPCGKKRLMEFANARCGDMAIG